MGRCVHGSLEMPLQPPESLQAAAGGPAGGHAAAGAAAGMDLAGPSLTPLEEGLLKWRCTFVVSRRTGCAEHCVRWRRAARACGRATSR